MNVVDYNPIDPAPFENAGPIAKKRNNTGLIIFGIGLITATAALIFINLQKRKLEQKIEKEEG